MKTFNFDHFKSVIEQIYKQCKSEEDSGKLPEYIPQLATQDPELFGISILTVDGKEFNIGDSTTKVCIQSCCKPLLYGLALEEHGIDKVSEHIGKEPSGDRFNSFRFDDTGKPFNPLINAGAIMSSSLVRNDMRIDQRFEYILNVWKDIIGTKPPFDNSVFLSEKQTAHRNIALTHFLQLKLLL